MNIPLAKLPVARLTVSFGLEPAFFSSQYRKSIAVENNADSITKIRAFSDHVKFCKKSNK